MEAGYSRKNSEETRSEYIHKAQSIVNGIQIKALSDVMKLLAEHILARIRSKNVISLSIN